MGLSVWGPPSTTRRVEVQGVHANLRRWNKASDPTNPTKVFVGSMMDYAESHPDADGLRPGLWAAIRANERLVFQLLTKRADRVASLLPPFWPEIKARVWLGVSIENNAYAHRADGIRGIDSAVRFVSYEPALGPLDALNLDGLDWVIVGGESGPNWRPMDLQWARDLRVRCHGAGVVFFWKQGNGIRTEMHTRLDGETVREYPTRRVPLPIAQVGRLF
jgi:protein gp37